jgi:large subunit ribosomal protein L14
MLEACMPQKKEACMIQVGTHLQVSDNSGARLVQCIKVLRKTRQGMGRVGDTVVISVKALVRKQKSKVKKGHLYKAVVLETKKRTTRPDGSVFGFARNTVILLSVQGTPIGSRIQGFTPYELREKKHTKLLSLSMANV